MDTMKAVIIIEKSKVEVLDWPMPEVGKDDILLKVDTSMLCTIDQRVFAGVLPEPLPFLGGHEFSGSIVKIGENVDPKMFPVGTKAVGNMIYTCGTCPACKASGNTFCSKMDFHQFGLAEFIAVRKEFLHIAACNISYEKLAFAEPLGCVIRAFDKFDLNFGETIVIIGGGIMGQLAVALAKNRGARIILSDPVEFRRKDAVRNGANTAIDPTENDPVEQVRKLTNGAGVNVVFNTAGVLAVIPQGLAMLKSGGSFMMYGKYFPDEPVPVSFNNLHDRQLKVYGTRGAGNIEYSRSINLLCTDRVNPIEMGLLSEVYPKEECNKAFERAFSIDTYRVAIKF